MKTLRLGFLVAAASACASSTPAPATNPGEIRVGQQSTTAGRNRDVITAADIAADPAMKAQTVLQVIRVLRPHFLTDRGMSGMTALDERTGTAYGDPEAGKVHVSIDNGRIVSLSELNEVHAGNVVEIRFLNVAQAMQKFGPNARQGPVIFVKTSM